MQRSGSAEQLKRSVSDPEAFGEFYEAHFRDVLRYLTRRSSDGQTGLDLTAETFAQAYLSRRGFRGSTDAEAAAWLFRIATRQLARYLRKGRLERRALARLGMEPRPLESETEREIERFAQLDELRAALGAELEGLTPAHRAALQPRVVDAGISSRMGRCSSASARVRSARETRARAAGSVMESRRATSGYESSCRPRRRRRLQLGVGADLVRVSRGEGRARAAEPGRRRPRPGPRRARRGHRGALGSAGEPVRAGARAGPPACAPRRLDPRPPVDSAGCRCVAPAAG